MRFNLASGWFPGQVFGEFQAPRCEVFERDWSSFNAKHCKQNVVGAWTQGLLWFVASKGTSMVDRRFLVIA